MLDTASYKKHAVEISHPPNHKCLTVFQMTIRIGLTKVTFVRWRHACLVQAWSKLYKLSIWSRCEVNRCFNSPPGLFYSSAYPGCIVRPKCLRVNTFLSACLRKTRNKCLSYILYHILPPHFPLLRFTLWSCIFRNIGHPLFCHRQLLIPLPVLRFLHLVNKYPVSVHAT